MEDEVWTILDSLELDGKDREVAEELLELPDRAVISCSDEQCVFYSTIQATSDTIKRLPLTRVADTPLLVYSGEKLTAVALVVPPYVHLVLVVTRTRGNEPA